MRICCSNKAIVLIASALMLLSCEAGARGGDGILNADPLYKVELLKDGKWKKTDVLSAKVSDYAPNPAEGYPQHIMNFSMFTDDFEDSLKIRITLKGGRKFGEVAIRPLSYGIKPTFSDGKSVEFTLPDPGKKVSVEFDGDRLGNLFILPDLPDAEVPQESDSVLYFGPGVHEAGLINVVDKDNYTIYIDEGSVVLGRINAERSDNLRICGRGVLCSSKENHGEGRSPQITTIDCDNLSLEGIMLRDTPNWTLKIVGSDGVHIDNIKEIGWIMNSDGMDFVCCSNVLVENTFQRNYDDNISIKAFNGTHSYKETNSEDYAAGMVASIPQDKFKVENYEIRNCVFWADKAHNMLVGPEARGLSFNNIRFHDNIVLENRQDDETYPGTMAIMVADNGTFDNISFEDIIVEDINGGKVFCVQFTNSWAYAGLYGQWARNITFRNISHFGNRASGSRLFGLNESQCLDSVVVDNYSENGVKVSGADNCHIEMNEYVKNVIFE
ncbi:MAG: glycosyl hydrolase family 28 protein [Bacteroidales bacterium]